MKIEKVLLYAMALFIFSSCEDILESPDISNETVVIFAPLEGTVVTGNTVNFNWDTLDEARSYRFQLAQPNFGNAQQFLADSIITIDSLGNVGTQITQTLFNGAYEWRVQALNGGFETAFFTNAFQVNGDENADLDPPNTPALVAPANGTTQDDTLVNFSWTREDVPGSAERDSIYFFSDENLETLVGSDIGANKTYAASFSSGTFFWLVRAFDAAGNESENSSTFSFTIN